MSLPKFLKYSVTRIKSAVKISDPLTLKDLPTNILQSIFQILITSKNFSSVLCMRTVCKTFYELINGFTLFLSMKICCDRRESKNFSSYVDYVTEYTNWKLEKLAILFVLNLDEEAGISNWKIATMVQYIEDKRQFFGEKLRVLTLRDLSFRTDRNVYYLGKIAGIVCNERTVINLDFDLSVCWDKFPLCDRILSSNIYIQNKHDLNCLRWSFSNLNKLDVVCYDNSQLDISAITRFKNLRELRVRGTISLLQLASIPTSEAFFPKVKYLSFLHYERNDDQLGEFLSIHFPNLEYLEIHSVPEFRKYSIMNFPMFKHRKDKEGLTGA